MFAYVLVSTKQNKTEFESEGFLNVSTSWELHHFIEIHRV